MSLLDLFEQANFNIQFVGFSAVNEAANYKELL